MNSSAKTHSPMKMKKPATHLRKPRRGLSSYEATIGMMIVANNTEMRSSFSTHHHTVVTPWKAR